MPESDLGSIVREPWRPLGPLLTFEWTRGSRQGIQQVDSPSIS